jgi:hypothetical protein
MPTVLKPDMKALVWAGIGLFLVPKAIKLVRR